MAAIVEKSGISVVSAVAEQLPFENNQFDLVLMVTVICFLDDVLQAFTEAYRVLKPGGSVISPAGWIQFYRVKADASSCTAGVTCLAVPTAMSSHHDFSNAAGIFASLQQASAWVDREFL